MKKAKKGIETTKSTRLLSVLAADTTASRLHSGSPTLCAARVVGLGNENALAARKAKRRLHSGTLSLRAAKVAELEMN